jgi:hypothetical protein
VTRCGFNRVQELLLGNGLQDSQLECYNSCGCDKHLCHYMAAPPPRSHRGVGYGRLCWTRPLRQRMLFGCSIPVACRCFSGIWVENYGCAESEAVGFLLLVSYYFLVIAGFDIDLSNGQQFINGYVWIKPCLVFCMY